MTKNIKQHEINIRRTPLPIETEFFIDDPATNICKESKRNSNRLPIIDKEKFNRYYFNYPAEWKTK